MRKKMLSMSAENALRKEIKKGGGNENGDIFSQLEFLTETVEKFGEKSQYLSLRTKKLLATMLDPDYRLEYIVEKQEGKCCTVEARLYWSDQEKPSGVGFVKRYLSQIAPRDSLTQEERESLMEATCRGLAASRALTEAGIGQHLFGEVDDFEKKEEEADVSKALELQMEKELPQPKTFNEKKGGVKNTPATTLPLPEQEPEPEFIPEEEDLTVPELPDKPEIMSIDEAKSQVADKGTYMGTTLGEIYELNPKNLVWLYHQDSVVKDAAAILVRTIPELAAKLN